jgi:hypothetical protein
VSAHTPGPWTVNGPWHIQAATDYAKFKEDGYTPIVVAQIVKGHGIELDMMEANARLIAAAPEMLEALQNFREWWANHFEDFEPDINGELLCLDNDFAAAIANAEGRSVHA